MTGVAGPGGGTDEKPVGTTWIALAGPESVVSAMYRYTGDRERNRRLATAGALDMLRRVLTRKVAFDPERLTWGSHA